MSHPMVVSLSLTGDIISAIAIIGAFMGYLPDIAAGAALLWYLMQIYDWLEGKIDKS